MKSYQSYLRFGSFFLLPLFCLFFVTSNARGNSIYNKVVKLKRTTSYTLTAQELRNMAKAPFKSQFIIEGNKIRASQNHTLYLGKHPKNGNMLFFLETQPGTKSKEFLDVDLTPFFEIVLEYVNFVWYCSCGSNTTSQDGDNCMRYETSSGVHCGGGCTGDQTGKSCSNTVFNINTGEINSSS